jgi:hypothetical protein
MPRPLRFVPEQSLVEITTRTLQGRLLLKPSSELTDIILGVIGKAQELYGMTIHAFVFLSTHAHFLALLGMFGSGEPRVGARQWLAPG